MNRRLFTSVLFACLLPFMVQATAGRIPLRTTDGHPLKSEQPQSYGRFIAFHCTN